MTAQGTECAGFLGGAAAAAHLLAEPAVAGSWDQPSALPEFPVSGLAGHLARQVLMVPVLLAGGAPAGEPVSVLEHYARVPWAGAGLDHEVNAAVRRSGQEAAACGPAELASRTGEAVTQLRRSLPAEPADRLLPVPGGTWLLALPGFLLTRLVEIVVHADDLAVSAGIPGPPMPPEATDAVLVLLTRLAARRHGPAAVLRALCRAERAPATIAAF